jgi:hypothetical protein
MQRRGFIAGLLVSGLVLSTGFANKAESKDSNLPLNLKNARIFINEKQQPGAYSAVMTNFKFLYFYIPSQGLFVISSSEFDHAVQAGKFQDRELLFDVSGIGFRLVSSGSILGKVSRPLWVNYDPKFTLDVKSIMFGYGDEESAPYDWPKQIGKHI